MFSSIIFKFFAPLAVVCLFVLAVPGCANPANPALSTPTPALEKEASQAVIAAREAVLDFMREGAIISVPYAGASWEPGLGPSVEGFEVYQFSGNHVILTVSYPIEETSETVYHVTLNNLDLGFCWQANVNATGQVIQTGLGAEMFPELVQAASHYCQEQGYQYEMNPKDEEKQCGTCTFSDGSTCNAWAFYQGFCQPGDHSAEE